METDQKEEWVIRLIRELHGVARTEELLIQPVVLQHPDKFAHDAEPRLMFYIYLSGGCQFSRTVQI